MTTTIVLYSFIIIASVALAHFASKNKDKKSFNIFICLIILLLSLFSGLRNYNVGTDTERYTILFLNYGANNTVEFGFQYIVKFLMTIYYNPTFVFIIIAFAINSLCIIRLWYFRNHFDFQFGLLSYCVLFYFTTFSGIRQFLSVSILFFFSKWLLEGKYIKFLLVILLCMSIHSSAVISIILLPVVFCIRETRDGKITQKHLIELCIGIIIIPIIFIYIYNYLQAEYSNFFTEYYKDVSIGLMVFFKILLLGFACWGVFLKNKKNNSNYHYLIKIILFCDLIYQVCCISGYFYDNVARIGWYFLAYEPILYGYIWKNRKTNVELLISSTMIVVVLFYTYYTMLVADGNNIVPYQFVQI